MSFTESQYEVSAVKYEEKELANVAIGRYNYQYNFQIPEETRQETVLHIVLGKKINELQLVPASSSVEKNTTSQQGEFLVFDMSTIEIANDTGDTGEVTYEFKNAERLNRWGYFFDETNKSQIMADKDCNPLVDYDMEIIVTGKNGKQAEFNLHVSIANQYGLKSGSKVSLKENELVYGDTLEKLEFNQSSISFLKNDNTQQAVSGTICWREPDSVFHVGTHEAVWVFTPDDSDYMPTYGTLKFKVNPVQKGNPPAIQAVYGQTLEQLNLPQGYYFKNTGATPVGDAGTRIFPVYYRSDNADYAVEKLMLELGERSGIEDIRMFSEILMTAKKTGGNLVKIMKRTADNISEKIETKREIETVIAGKKMEARCMNVIPFGIIVYLRVFSPGFLDPLYGNLAGILIMTVSLMVYAGAFWWSYKITDISV